MIIDYKPCYDLYVSVDFPLHPQDHVNKIMFLSADHIQLNLIWLVKIASLQYLDIPVLEATLKIANSK